MSTTLILEEVIGLYQALAQLDGYNTVNKDGSVSLVPYNFSDSTRWNIVKNKKLLKGEVEAYEEIRQGWIKELSPVKLDVAKEEPGVLEAFRIRSRDFLKKSVEINGLLKIKDSELLKENKNPIAASIIELLYPVIEFTPEK